MVNFVNGTSGNDEFQAGESAVSSYYQGFAGNDRIVAGVLDDTLDGGAGDDTLAGADGSNTYFFGRGDGNDIIYGMEGCHMTH